MRPLPFHDHVEGRAGALKARGMRLGTFLDPQRRRVRLGALAVLLLGWVFAPSAFGAQARANFDHLTTGFELIGQHRDLPCEACHANAMFKGTATQCSACHGVGTVIRATAKPLNSPPTPGKAAVTCPHICPMSPGHSHR